MAIKQFDENGLKELNNRLAKQDKLIKKLMKQGGGSSVPTPSSTGTTDLVPESIIEGGIVPAYGIAREDGRLELFDISGDIDDDISPTKTAYVHETQGKIAIPSSYFLDLRGIFVTTATQQYTADLLVLHNTSGDTLSITSVDETNNVGTAGPIAGGRDQLAAFSASSWIHFFIIYNPVTGDISSLSSASPTAPTLPTGYTFFVRVGCAYFGVGSTLRRSYQMGDKVVSIALWLKWDDHADANPEEVTLIAYVPATAKMVHGIIGLSAGTTVRKMYVASDVDGYIKVGSLSDAAGTGDAAYDGISGSKDFSLPLLTAQTIWWRTETTNDVYALGISGFTDDL